MNQQKVILQQKKNCIMLYVSLAKAERNTWQVLSSFTQNYTEICNISSKA